MKKEIVVFGTGDFADIVSFVAEQKLGWRIIAYTVSKGLVEDGSAEYNGRPLVPFDRLEKLYKPENVELVIGMIGKNMFDQRSGVFDLIRGKGYYIPNIIDPDARVDTENIGSGNVILAHTSIEAHCSIGSGNIIWQNVVLPHHNRLGSFNNLAPSVSLSGYSEIGNHCFVGNNVCIKNRTAVGDYAYIGAGAYVSGPVEPYSVLVPHPSYVLEGKRSYDFSKPADDQQLHL